MLEQYRGLDKSQPLSGTLLGFDYGLKKMGVAVGQTITKTARPLAHLKMCDGIPNWKQLDDLLKQWQPAGLVVGIPVNKGFEDQRLSQAAQKFARRIKARYHLPTFGIDEHLTTFEAKQVLAKHEELKAWRWNSVDRIAATVILESWLREFSEMT